MGSSSGSDTTNNSSTGTSAARSDRG
jgi:hypothetical protein